jgi:hypothetical protein
VVSYAGQAGSPPPLITPACLPVARPLLVGGMRLRPIRDLPPRSLPPTPIATAITTRRLLTHELWPCSRYTQQCIEFQSQG